ncbi:EcsC family protein [Methylobacterium oryzihabitans]|uniref:EcsC family protein n=2 Tax=Methylobacterium oryzihabitans TaxID=2499852 RepID=A0A3S2YLD0_9HYPH|nr:EcsC family protein [Methylobacterium oryzihabitans]
MTEIVSMETATPVAPGAPERLGEADLAALRAAITTLEKPSLAGRLAGLAGAPLEMIGRVLPEAVTDTVAQAAEGAIRVSLRTALATLPRGGTPADAAVPVPASPSLRARALDLLGRYPPGDRGHKALAALSGALGGAFGLSTLAVELPVSTTLMLRSIAEIAQREGEDLGTPEAALACMQVFALGGRAGDSKAVESGYFAVRAALAHAMADAARYAAGRGLLDESAPALARLAAQIASRFGLVVSQKAAAQAVPVVGALGGAAVNTAFMDHYQGVARAHFTVRRLERRYGKETVRAAYEAERAALGLAPEPGQAAA